MPRKPCPEDKNDFSFEVVEGPFAFEVGNFGEFLDGSGNVLKSTSRIAFRGHTFIKSNWPDPISKMHWITNLLNVAFKCGKDISTPPSKHLPSKHRKICWEKN